MAKPRIVGETKRPLKEREPPRAGLELHGWVSGDDHEELLKLIRDGGAFDVYLSKRGEEKIRVHAEREASRRLEVMGFLLGEAFTWKGRPYSVIMDAVTTELRSSSSKVRFDPRAFPKLFQDLDGSGFDYIIIGWYHSHPGHTCFLSGTDLETQRSMFNQPYHIALVIDPINKEVRTFRLCRGGYEETAFVMFSATVKGQTPLPKPRTRRLKVQPSHR